MHRRSTPAAGGAGSLPPKCTAPEPASFAPVPPPPPPHPTTTPPHPTQVCSAPCWRLASGFCSPRERLRGGGPCQGRAEATCPQSMPAPLPACLPAYLPTCLPGGVCICPAMHNPPPPLPPPPSFAATSSCPCPPPTPLWAQSSACPWSPPAQTRVGGGWALWVEVQKAGTGTRTALRLRAVSSVLHHNRRLGRGLLCWPHPPPPPPPPQSPGPRRRIRSPFWMA